MPENDNILMERFARTGDAEAYAEVVRRYTNLVYAACHRIIRNPALAEDAAQETFLQLLRQPETVKGSLVCWLHTTATWKAIDATRKDSVRRRRESGYRTPVSAGTSPWEEISPCIDEVLAEMGEEDRELIIQHFLKGWTQGELAQEWKISQPSVSRKIQTALEELRKGLRKRGVMVGIGLLTTLLLRNTTEAASMGLVQELGKMAALAGAKSVGGDLAATTVVTLTKGKCIAAGLTAIIAVGGMVGYKYMAGHDALNPRIGGNALLTMRGEASQTAPEKNGGRDSYYGRPVGMLFYQEAQVISEDVTRGWKPIGTAIAGQIHLPREGKLRLDVNKAGSRYLSVLKEVGSDRLSMLMLCSTDAGDRGMGYVSKLTSLEILHVHGTSVTDAGAAELGKLKKLRHLDISNTGLTNRGLAYLSGLTGLEYLNLSRTNIGNEGLVFLDRMAALKTLDLSGTSITDEGLISLKALKSLRNLVLSGDAITDAGVDVLSELTSLETLTLTGTRITDNAMVSLKKLTSLKCLRLSLPQVGDAGLANLRELKFLRMLELFQTKLTDEGLKSLSHLNSLEALYLGPGTLTDGGVSDLARLTSLKTLYLNSVRITDVGMRSIGKMRNLETLGVDGPITDTGLDEIRNLKSLKRLQVSGAKITGAGLECIKDIPSLEMLDLVNLKLGPKGLSSLAGNTSLKGLGISNSDLNDHDLSFIGGLKSLTSLCLTGNVIDDAAAVRLEELPSLENLFLVNTRITNQGLASVGKHRKLKRLVIGGQITDAGLHSLDGLTSLNSLRVMSQGVTEKGLTQLEWLPSLQLVTAEGETGLSYGQTLQSAPPLEARTVDGKILNLEEYRGKVVLLHFWSEEGRETSPQRFSAVKSLYESLSRDKRFAMIGLGLDDEVSHLKRTAQRLGLTWPQVYLGPYSSITTEYMIQGPGFVLVNGEGKIAGRFSDCAGVGPAVKKAIRDLNTGEDEFR